MWYFVSDSFKTVACHMSLNFIFPYVKRNINNSIY